jgi:hypothetical protein
MVGAKIPSEIAKLVEIQLRRTVEDVTDLPPIDKVLAMKIGTPGK